MKKPLITILKILTFFFGWTVETGLIAANFPDSNPTIWRFFSELIPLVIIIIFTVVFLLFEKGRIKLPIKRNIRWILKKTWPQ